MSTVSYSNRYIKPVMLTLTGVIFAMILGAIGQNINATQIKNEANDARITALEATVKDNQQEIRELREQIINQLQFDEHVIQYEETNTKELARHHRRKHR